MGRAGGDAITAARHGRRGGGAVEAPEASRVLGCLLGGAVGDALGAPVEFLNLEQIRGRFGADGIVDFSEAYGRVGAVTDDTQMTLFTVEGLLRAYVRYTGRGICSPPGVIQHAYLRWARTQGVPLKAEVAQEDAWPDGWLVKVEQLWARRAPGNTCTTALSQIVKLGDRPENESKGAGALMRVAPVGLVARLEGDPILGSEPAPYALGCESSALTHGHPTSRCASGFFALLVSLLARGEPLRRAIELARLPLEAEHCSDEVLVAIDLALAAVDSDAPATPETVERLGAGWVADEALAIALFCAARAASFEHGVCLAANISGDSDTTASLVGQLLGVQGGIEAIPDRWLRQLELHDVIDTLARDLAALRWDRFNAEANEDRYPGW